MFIYIALQKHLLLVRIKALYILSCYNHKLFYFRRNLFNKPTQRSTLLWIEVEITFIVSQWEILVVSM